MIRSYKISRPSDAPAWLLALSVLQGCSLLSGSFSEQPQFPPQSATQAGGVTTPTNDNGSADVERSKNDKAKPAMANQPARIGEASWYGPGFGGKKTASGDIFDDAKLTAAHRTLPLGSRAKITNLSNGKIVEVKINDRGPNVAGRIIDLSQAAAKALGMIDRGTAKVRIELLSNVDLTESAQNIDRQ